MMKLSKEVSLEAFGGACRIVGTRNSLRTPKGTFSKRDFVYWGIHAGIAKQIIQVVDGGGRCQFAGVFEKYAPARGNVWASAGKVVVVVERGHLKSLGLMLGLTNVTCMLCLIACENENNVVGIACHNELVEF